MIYINVDLSQILKLGEELEGKAREVLSDALKDLSTQAHAHIVEQVNEKLHSTRAKYIEALKFQEVGNDTWLITLEPSALWIEEGIPANKEMIDDLLKSNKAKMSKDGSRYLSIPFKHGPGVGRTTSTPAQQDLTATIKSEMKRRGIPYGNIEKDSHGNPKLGLLHKFDIKNSPLKTGLFPGQGKGLVGHVRQGPTGIPFLQGVRVYQRQVQDKAGKGSVQRGIMTFRTVSSKHKGTGRWVHPGLTPKNFFEEAADWAAREWEQHIRDKVLDSLEKNL